MTLAVNVDFRYAAGYPSVYEALRFGVTMARCTSLPEMEPAAAAYLSVGIKVLAAYTGESDNAGRYILRNASAMQIGNEPQFAMDGAASWPTGSTEDFINVWNHVSTVLIPAVHPNGIPLVGPGIWSQDYAKWAYVARDLPGLSASAVHVYNVTAAQAKYNLSRYRNVRADLPLICTEWSARQPNVLGVAQAIDAYCQHKIFFAWGPGVPGHELYGTPEFGILSMAG